MAIVQRILVMCLWGIASAFTPLSRKISILHALRRQPFATEAELATALPPTIPLVEISKVIREVDLYARVPAWFHEMLVQHGQGATGAAETRRIAEMAVRKAEELAGKSLRLDIVKFELAVARWLKHCVNPSVNWENICSKTGQGYWSLSEASKAYLIDEILLETLPNPSQTPGPIPYTIIKQITKAFREDISRSPWGVAEQFAIRVEQADAIKQNMLHIFQQPAWFMELLLGFEGPGNLDPSNPVLKEAIKEEAKARKSPVHGDLDAAITTWIEICIIPIREGKVNPLPYVRTYPVVNGQERELVQIVPNLIQQYLSSP